MHEIDPTSIRVGFISRWCRAGRMGSGVVRTRLHEQPDAVSRADDHRGAGPRPRRSKIEVYQKPSGYFREPLPAKQRAGHSRIFPKRPRSHRAYHRHFDGAASRHIRPCSTLSEAADDLALASAVLTFEPHPREFLRGPNPPAGCPRCATSSSVFASDGVARVHVVGSNASLASALGRGFIDRC